VQETAKRHTKNAFVKKSQPFSADHSISVFFAQIEPNLIIGRFLACILGKMDMGCVEH
jgi:hypothetical protein